MRCKEEYKALLTKINVQKGNYAEKEMVVSNELEQKIQLTTEKIKKWTVRIVIYVAVMMVLLGIIFNLLTYINQRWLITVVFFTMVGIFCVLAGFEIFFKVKLYKLNKQKSAVRSFSYCTTNSLCCKVVYQSRITDMHCNGDQNARSYFVHRKQCHAVHSFDIFYLGKRLCIDNITHHFKYAF